ncbi:uncharacterized protein LOC142329181 [Lycorma delicatula]|uniref:uncharacterized protein LOC142329181 n=1 Tax=Lycorma delicatula TaxID=130591 RepID=UPI003F516614
MSPIQTIMIADHRPYWRPIFRPPYHPLIWFQAFNNIPSTQQNIIHSSLTAVNIISELQEDGKTKLYKKTEIKQSYSRLTDTYELKCKVTYHRKPECNDEPVKTSTNSCPPGLTSSTGTSSTTTAPSGSTGGTSTNPDDNRLGRQPSQIPKQPSSVAIDYNLPRLPSKIPSTKH